MMVRQKLGVSGASLVPELLVEDGWGSRCVDTGRKDGVSEEKTVNGFTRTAQGPLDVLMPVMALPIRDPVTSLTTGLIIV